jgi:hypothetical protein
MSYSVVPRIKEAACSGVSHFPAWTPPSRKKKVFASYFFPYRMGEKSAGRTAGAGVNAGRVDAGTAGPGAAVEGSGTIAAVVGVVNTSTENTGPPVHPPAMLKSRMTNKTLVFILSLLLTLR